MPANLVREDIDVLRALADPLRWEIVQRLAREQLCVCHLTEDLGVAQPLVSHHLKVLRDAGLIEGERFRYWTYYQLHPEALHLVAERLDGLAADAPGAEEGRRACC